MLDHIPLCLSLSPQYSVAHTIVFLKGKNAVRIHRELLPERRMTGLHFWAAEYSVSTVGLDEARGRQSIREQEELESRQGEFDFESHIGPVGAFPTWLPPLGAFWSDRPRRGQPDGTGPLGGPS